MKICVCAFIALTGLLQAQTTPAPDAAPAPNPMAGPAQPNREAPVTPVPFDRILRANQEPQNWLTYSGTTMSQRYSALTQITPDNAKDLTLKWVFQSKSLEKHEVTPLVVDGVMYTVQGINDVFALDAATGKTIWTLLLQARPDRAQLLRPGDARPGDSGRQDLSRRARYARDRDQRQDRQGNLEDPGRPIPSSAIR